MTSSEREKGWSANEIRLAGMLIAVASLAALSLMLAWLVPTVAAWVQSGQIPQLALWTGVRTVVDGDFWSRDPASAYPTLVAKPLPHGRDFWLVAALAAITLLASVFALLREAEIRMSRPAADRRWWQLRGLRPQEFGRYRTVPELIASGPSPERVIVGRIGRPGALVGVDAKAQMAVIAAPRTGKSSGLIIPSLLEHEGPVVTTSVRTDVVQHTLARRRRLGRVWVWDPFGPRSDPWDLLQGCEDWEHALLVARWLGHARRRGEGISQDYFDQEAESLVAPYLHAAALTPDVTAEGIFRWVLDRDTKTALPILEDAEATDAIDRLKAVYAYTERQRDGIIGTAAMQLKAYGHPAAARTAIRGDGVTPGELLTGRNTLYIVAGREHQQLLAPLVVTMVSSMMHDAGERENRSGTGLVPPALFALDETASIAPIQDLPQILATSLGAGVRFLTVWHSVAQIRRLYGADAAAEILALSQAKVFMGSITDQDTRDELVELLGRRQRPGMSDGPRADVMTAQALQRTSSGEGLLITGDLPPIIFRQRRHYRDRGLARLKGAPSPFVSRASHDVGQPRQSVPGALGADAGAGGKPNAGTEAPTRDSVRDALLAEVDDSRASYLPTLAEGTDPWEPPHADGGPE